METENLKSFYINQFDYSYMAFKELENGNDPGLLFKNKNRDFREMIDAKMAFSYHNSAFERVTFEEVDNQTIEEIFKKLVKIQNLFSRKWGDVFSMEETNPIKIEWKELLSEYNTIFVSQAYDQWIQYYDFLKIRENTVVVKKLKLGDKELMAFSYLIGKMIDSGIILAPYDFDSNGAKVVNYAELARSISMLFEINGTVKNLATHLNTTKNQLAKHRKDKIDKAFS